MPVGDCDSGSDELPGPEEAAEEEEEEDDRDTVESMIAAPSGDRARRFRCPAAFRRATMDFRNVYKALRIRWSRKLIRKGFLAGFGRPLLLGFCYFLLQNLKIPLCHHADEVREARPGHQANQGAV